jgi:hypothetical protein
MREFIKIKSVQSGNPFKSLPAVGRREGIGGAIRYSISITANRNLAISSKLTLCF